MPDEAQRTAPAQPEAAAVPEAQGSSEITTREELAKLPPDKKREFLARLAEGEPEAPAPTPADTATDAPTPEGTAPAEKPPEPVQTKDWRDAKREHQAAADEANKWIQKAEAAKRRAERAKAEWDAAHAAPVAKPEDFLDEDYQTKLHERLTKAEKALELFNKRFGELDEETLREVEPKAQAAQETRIWEDIQGLQERVPALKTSRPFSELNRELAEHYRKLASVANPHVDLSALPVERVQALEAEARARYTADAAFRAQADAAGAKEPEELDKVTTILRLHSYKEKEGFRTLRAAYREWLEENPQERERLEKASGVGEAERIRQAQIAAANATVAKVKEGLEAATTLGPSDGSSPDPFAAGELTYEKAVGQVRHFQALSKSRNLNQDEKANYRKALLTMQAGG